MQDAYFLRPTRTKKEISFLDFALLWIANTIKLITVCVLSIGAFHVITAILIFIFK